MTERPILFSAPMVRALLDDENPKTQTRRVVTPQPDFAQHHEWKGKVLRDAEARAWCWKQHDFGDGDAISATPGPEMAAHCPYGVPGDRLWVRETWHSPKSSRRYEVAYRADGVVAAAWKPSIFMPRWASRITLEVTRVRVERVQDISASDALAEGVSGPCIKDFQRLWDRINGKRPGCSWSDNPFVWAVSFRGVPS